MKRSHVHVSAADLERASAAVTAESEATCCHAASDKHWVTDPQGTVLWTQGQDNGRTGLRPVTMISGAWMR
jgi:hypothetical protein